MTSQVSRTISLAERERRAEVVRYGRGSVALSGFKLPPETAEIDRRYIESEIDIEQHGAEYRRLAGLSPATDKP